DDWVCAWKPGFQHACAPASELLRAADPDAREGATPRGPSTTARVTLKPVGDLVLKLLPDAGGPPSLPRRVFVRLYGEGWRWSWLEVPAASLVVRSPLEWRIVGLPAEPQGVLIDGDAGWDDSEEYVYPNRDGAPGFVADGLDGGMKLQRVSQETARVIHDDGTPLVDAAVWLKARPMPVCGTYAVSGAASPLEKPFPDDDRFGAAPLPDFGSLRTSSDGAFELRKS